MNSYVTYKTALGGIMNALGLSTLHHDVRPELAPYLTAIVGYLNERLVLLGDGAELKELLDEVLKVEEEGADLIVDLKAVELTQKVGLGDEGLELDRFIFCWTDFMSSLRTQILIQYAALFEKAVIQGCSCPCGSGETWKDWESYGNSGVYPEDEEYLGYGTTKWKVINNVPTCTCNR